MMTGRVARRLALVAVTAGLVTGFAPLPALASVPQPVYAPASGVADPGVIRSDNDFYVYASGPRVQAHWGDTAAGSWTSLGPMLTSTGDWAASNSSWAPDAVHTPAGWVLYYAAPATGFNDQRCIGVAIADTPTGPFTPVGDSPLICPGGSKLGADDSVPGHPVAGAGVIDPSPFQDSDGRRYILYKTQQTPSTLRMLRLNDNGTHWIGIRSQELVRRSGIIENPVLVQRGSTYVLFASRYGYDNCSYATVYLRSSDRWDFSGATEQPLMNTSTTGICGPGGADVTPSLDGGWRIFLHGWVCGTGTTACEQSQLDEPVTVEHRRVLYAAVLHWGSDGVTPDVGAFL